MQMKRAAESNTIGESDTRSPVQGCQQLLSFVEYQIAMPCLNLIPTLLFHGVFQYLMLYDRFVFFIFSIIYFSQKIYIKQIRKQNPIILIVRIQTTATSISMPHFVSHADNCRKVVKEECKVLLRSVIRRAQSIALLAALDAAGGGGRGRAAGY